MLSQRPGASAFRSGTAREPVFGERCWHQFRPENVLVPFFGWVIDTRPKIILHTYRIRNKPNIFSRFEKSRLWSPASRNQGYFSACFYASPQKLRPHWSTNFQFGCTVMVSDFMRSLENRPKLPPRNPQSALVGNLIKTGPEFRFVKQLVLVQIVKLGDFKTPISLSLMWRNVGAISTFR